MGAWCLSPARSDEATKFNSPVAFPRSKKLPVRENCHAGANAPVTGSACSMTGACRGEKVCIAGAGRWEIREAGSGSILRAHKKMPSASSNAKQVTINSSASGWETVLPGVFVGYMRGRMVVSVGPDACCEVAEAEERDVMALITF